MMFDLSEDRYIFQVYEVEDIEVVLVLMVE